MILFTLLKVLQTWPLGGEIRQKRKLNRLTRTTSGTRSSGIFSRLESLTLLFFKSNLKLEVQTDFGLAASVAKVPPNIGDPLERAAAIRNGLF